jgi:hypothetical protein
VIQKRSIFKSLCTCYFGAEMDEDESHHGPPLMDGSLHSGSMPDSSARARSQTAGSALACADRTVVRTLGDTVNSPGMPCSLLSSFLWPQGKGLEARVSLSGSSGCH